MRDLRRYCPEKKLEWILAYFKNFSKNNPIKSFFLKRR